MSANELVTKTRLAGYSKFPRLLTSHKPPHLLLRTPRTSPRYAYFLTFRHARTPEGVDDAERDIYPSVSQRGVSLARPALQPFQTPSLIRVFGPLPIRNERYRFWYVEIKCTQGVVTDDS